MTLRGEGGVWDLTASCVDVEKEIGWMDGLLTWCDVEMSSDVVDL